MGWDKPHNNAYGILEELMASGDAEIETQRASFNDRLLLHM